MIDRKLHFVLGKGGVGKTTVASALASMFARRGRRTLAVEMDAAGRLPAMLGYSGPAPAPHAVSANLSVLSLDGRAALEEYLALVIPVKRVLTTIFSSRVYQYFVAAAPGLRELMTMGKIWYEATRDERGRPTWDAIVVDAPATGHGLQYLAMPQVAHDTFGAGLVQREAGRVAGLLRDPAATAVHLVTLADPVGGAQVGGIERPREGVRVDQQVGQSVQCAVARERLQRISRPVVMLEDPEVCQCRQGEDRVHVLPHLVVHVDVPEDAQLFQSGHLGDDRS